MKDILKFVVYGGIFLIPFLALYVENDFFFPYITGKNFGFRIIVEMVFAAWVLLALYEPKYRPKFSWILAGFASFMAVMLVANILGESPHKSFWSNFERMEGYVALIHVFLYFVVVGSVMITEKLWNRYFYTIIFTACLLSLYAFAQISGYVEHRYQGFRADATLGNATYMAVYMLFLVFISLMAALRANTKWLRYVLISLSVLFAAMILQTATRGTTLGLLVGLGTAGLYISLFGTQVKSARKIALGGMATLVVLVGLFVAFKDAPFIQENPTLTRLANISLSEGSIRFMIWDMAIEGVKERPVLGWGQGNFNYLFNSYYNPELYAAEQWYDRVHNIVFDWLVAGGILGLITYFSIIVAALYYLFYLPLVKKDESFTLIERGLLIGLLGGYVFHNIFVFDNIISYIFYGTILAYIHARVSMPIPSISGAAADTRVVEQVAAPVVIVALVATVYFVNVPGIRAAGDIIDAFRTNDANVVLNEFDEALSRNSFANQEIREQLTQRAQAIMRTPQLPQEVKDRAFKRTEEELLKQIEEKPGDARVHVFISSFYRTTGNIEKAVEQLKIARELSPNKQQIIFEQGLAELQQNDYEAALAFFKEAYELEPSFTQAATYYATAALYAGETELVREIIDTDTEMAQFANDNLATQAAYNAKEYDLLEEMFRTRIERSPQDPQLRVNLAVIKVERGDRAGAIETLRTAAEEISSFKTQAETFIADLEAGRMPGQSEQPTVNVGGAEVESQTVTLPASNP